MSDNQGTYRRSGFDLIIYKIKQRSYELDEKNPVKLWLSFYIGLFFFAILLGVIFGLYIPFKTIDVNSARYVLSALIQSQAAVISIVITLTLIAVQVTAQTYSPRVTEVFKKHPNMWCFLTSYIISIAFSSIVLTYLVGTDLADSVATRISLYISCLLGIFLFFALILYIYNTLNLLNAENVLRRLTDGIYTQIPDEVGHEDDPFQPVFDVIYSAIRRFDLPTMSYGFKQAKNKYQLIVLKNRTHTNLNHVINKFLDDFKRCGFLLIERREEACAFEVVIVLAKIGKWSIDNEIQHSFYYAIEAIKDVGVQAANSKLCLLFDHSMDLMCQLGQIVAQLGSKQENVSLNSSIIPFMYNQGELGRAAVLNDMKHSGISAVISMGEVAEELIKINNRRYNSYILTSFMTVGLAAVENKSIRILDILTDTLQDLFDIAITNHNDQIAKEIMRIFWFLGRSTAGHELIEQTKNISDEIFLSLTKAYDSNATDIYDSGRKQLAEIRLEYPHIFEKYKPPSYADIQFDWKFNELMLRDEGLLIHEEIKDWIRRRDELAEWT